LLDEDVTAAAWRLMDDVAASVVASWLAALAAERRTRLDGRATDVCCGTRELHFLFEQAATGERRKGLERPGVV